MRPPGRIPGGLCMRILRRMLGAVLAISAALALLTLLTDALAGSPQLMLSLMERYAPPENTGSPQIPSRT